MKVDIDRSSSTRLSSGQKAADQHVKTGDGRFLRVFDGKLIEVQDYVRKNKYDEEFEICE